ncbi:MAG: proline dehydrogenase family protein [Acidimicrobiia bacterium]
MRTAILAVTDRSITRKLVMDTRAGRAVAERFVAGDTVESAIAAAVDLNEKGMSVSLDHLGEHVSAIGEAERATQSYLDCITAITDAGVDANISVKLTQLGMGLDDDEAAANLDKLASAAAGAETTVTVDMEESAFTETTIRIYEDAQKKHGNLGVAVQAYLFRSPEDINRIASFGGHIRLCKGAYAEPESLAYQSTADVDDAFDVLATTLMAVEGTRPAIASHDDGRLAHAISAAEERDGPWEIQMLYGVRRDLQAQLVAEGNNVRVYVPYGEAWYPYLTRRLAERPANLTFFARALVGR